jgi:hypothetical protein
MLRSRGAEQLVLSFPGMREDHDPASDLMTILRERKIKKN